MPPAAPRSGPSSRPMPSRSSRGRRAGAEMGERCEQRLLRLTRGVRVGHGSPPVVCPPLAMQSCRSERSACSGRLQDFHAVDMHQRKVSRSILFRGAENRLRLEHHQALRMPHLVSFAIRHSDHEWLKRPAVEKLANRIGVHGTSTKRVDTRTYYRMLLPACKSLRPRVSLAESRGRPDRANQPIHTAGRYHESTPMLGSPIRERRPAW